MIRSGLNLSDYANGTGGYNSPTGQGFDGVVKVNLNGIGSLTGSILYNGKAILTAGHGFANGMPNGGNIMFQTQSGTEYVPIKGYTLHPDYNKSTNNNDIAIVWLDDSAKVPVDADRYGIYQQNYNDPDLKVFYMAGYGMMGGGASPAFNNNYGLRLSAKNKFDAVGDIYSFQFGNDKGTQLIYDFDDGTKAHDALGHELGYADGFSSYSHLLGTSFGSEEGHLASGDSGCAAFSADGTMTILGTSTYITNSSYDVSSGINGTYGEIGAFTDMTHYNQWVDQAIRANYADAPKSANEVKNGVMEGDSGTSYAYFYVDKTWLGATSMGFSYATKDGTAKAGSDYIEQSGVFKLYQGETSGIIAIEIIGDTIKEGRETFYLEISTDGFDGFKVYGSNSVNNGARISLDASGKTIESVNIIGQVIVDNDFY